VALLILAWHFAATLFLIFSGMLLGVALNAMTGLLGRIVPLPQPVRLAIVCLSLAAMLSGIVFLGGTTIAQWMDPTTIASDASLQADPIARTFLTSWFLAGRLGDVRQLDPKERLRIRRSTQIKSDCMKKGRIR
jgi:predicted PurR-regulated permease PerM